MGRVAFVFSGQGDQHPGMGLSLYQNYPAAKSVFDRCNALRPGTSSQCFSGTDTELKETRNTQPCMFAMEMAGAAVLTDLGLFADAAAGFSLGELAALTYGGAFDLETGFELVCRRGELMQRDADKHATAMAAVLKLTSQQVEDLCAGHKDIYPVNYNCPGQITVSGLEASMPAFIADVKNAGGRALPLKVKGAFHSPFMSEAARGFSSELKNINYRPMSVSVYSNMTAEPYQTNVGLLLSDQISSPVRWEDIVRNMIASGVDTFIEVGPGKALCNLIARIDSGVRVFPISAYEDLSVLVQEVKSC